MKRKHTPGPWRVSPFEVNAKGSTRVVMGADDFGVAWLQGRSVAEHEADAALIAAAPALLKACKKLLPRGWDTGVMDHIPGVKEARFAIAQAERKQPK